MGFHAFGAALRVRLLAALGPRNDRPRQRSYKMVIMSQNTEFGRELIASMQEAAAIMRGETEPARVHLPPDAVDLRAIQMRLASPALPRLLPQPREAGVEVGLEVVEILEPDVEAQ